MIVLIFSSDKHNLFGQKYLSVQLLSFIIYYLASRIDYVLL